MDMELMTNARIESIKNKTDKLIQHTKKILQTEEKNTYIEYYKKIKLFLLYAQDEIALHHAKLEVESLDKIWKKSSVEFLKLMKIFSLCASMESESKVILHPLTSDSVQASQCRQAVYDSVDPRLLSGPNAILKGIEVSNVFKLENHILSQDFQVSSTIVKSEYYYSTDI